MLKIILIVGKTFSFAFSKTKIELPIKYVKSTQYKNMEIEFL